MFHPATHGPAYLTTAALDACLAWEADDTQWVLTDGHAYQVGYAPGIFRVAPMAQGWRLTCPEELMQRALHD